MPKVNQKPSGQNTKINIFNIEFPEALNKLLDLICSNVRGRFGLRKLDFDAAREGPKKRQKQKEAKVRAGGKIGRKRVWEPGRCLVSGRCLV